MSLFCCFCIFLFPFSTPPVEAEGRRGGYSAVLALLFPCRQRQEEEAGKKKQPTEWKERDERKDYLACSASVQLALNKTLNGLTD